MTDAARSTSRMGWLPLGARRRSSGHESISGGAAARPRGRLFRKYVLLLVGLVSLVLLLNSALDFWFSYEENKAALFRIQQEKAASAAHWIEEFVDDIERQLGWTTAPQWGASPLEQRRFDYVRLLRQAPAITELIQLDDTGKEQLKVSRLAMDVVGSEKDYSGSPSFIEARQHRVWFSPVYFRKESEPYMTVALARTGRNAGVTVAEVNLKLIWDVITSLKIGQRGYAYVVDRDGRLIAHPDISLVLRNTDLAALPQVARHMPKPPPSPPPQAGGGLGWGQPTEQAVIAQGINGNSVLTAHAAIAPLGWTVFVELPLNEALAPLYGTMLRTAALLALALVLATLAALLLARRMTVPIRELQAGAARIGAGELDRHIDIHTGDELEDLAGDFNRMATDLQKSYANLEKKVEDRTAELKEALDQQTATAEVLGVINSSPGNLAPVFDAMLEKALTLCEAVCGQLATFDGEMFEFVALKGDTRWLERRPQGRLAPSRGLTWSRIVAGEPYVHILDALDTEAHRFGQEGARDAAIAGGRTFLTVALRREQALLGALTVYRQEVRPFTDKQIALLQNFAAQAVIAMENARLITETREALEQQTATAEVLGVINSSPGDLAPVFESIVEKAHNLCGAACGSLQLWDGEKFRGVAMRGFSQAMAEGLRQGYIPGPNHPCRRLLEGERIAHCADLAEIDDPVTRAGGVALGSIRTILFVALRKDDVLLGQIVAARQEVRPFTEKEIALVENFAAQAVIAMENARLITETREALEQQTATAEVLQVINSSPGDLAPVFDAILDKAQGVCSVDHAALELYDGERMHAVAVHGASDSFAETLRQGYRASDSPAARVLLEGQRFAQIPDATQIDQIAFRTAAEVDGVRTVLFVPLRRDDAFLGMIASARREVHLFSEKDIALLENFAAQAVIAMENARLITETREALEQQTATAEVLQVINSSPGDLTPVFDAILEKAHALCGAAKGSLVAYDGECYRTVASRGLSAAYAKFLRELRREVGSFNSPSERLRRGESLVQIPNLETENDPISRAAAELEGARTVLFVPLRKDGALLGYMTAYRQEVRPFSNKQIALLQNFAAQAVIAMENVRLITELRQRTRDLQESLEYQTATSDVLKVISRSGTELEPVLKTLVETAARICDADKGVIVQQRGGLLHTAASFGFTPELDEFVTRHQTRPGRGNISGRALLDRRVVHVEDVAKDPEYTWTEGQERLELHTGLAVPLLREDAVIGVINLWRSRVEPFTEKQVELVRTFADQSVIAIENARLFNELRARTNELGSSVAELKMLSEVGQAVSSTLDLRTVLSTILNASLGVTWANAGAVFRYSRAERAFRLVEAVGWDEALAHSVRELHVAETESAMGEAVARRMPVQLADLAQRASYPLRDITLAAGFHSALIVPLVGAERILGAIILMRQEAGEFPAETVRLMQTLASQSVLAIQNARLFREIADKSEQLALASQHKSQFLANMSHELRTPLNAILGYAELLVDGIYGVLPDRPRGVLDRIQNNGKHLLALINDVLDLAKIEAGQLTLTLEDYSLPEVVKSVVTAAEPLATSKGLKFTAIVQDDLPMAHGDARRVSQVLLNLVGNAIKFTDKGEVEVRAIVENGQFVLTVRDTGPGIADADQDRIFGEFQQIDNSNTRKKGGTGLGLAISKRMVEMQGGTISVDSLLGQGSTFRVVLPVHVDEMMEEAA